MRADRSGMEERLRLVDRRTVGQRYHCADPWGGHQPPAHRVAADHIQQHLVQDGQLLPHDPADTEQRLDDRGQPRKSCDELADPRVVSRKLLTTPTFKPKLRSVPRKSDATSSSLR